MLAERTAYIKFSSAEHTLRPAIMLLLKHAFSSKQELQCMAENQLIAASCVPAE